MRARELLGDLAAMARRGRARAMGCGVERFAAKLADEDGHVEMAERWARMDVPAEGLSAFIRRKAYEGFRSLTGEPSAERADALLGFLDAEVGALRAHWTASNSYLAGSMRALAEMKEAHTQLPHEHRPFLRDSVSQTRLDVFLISMSLVESGLDNPASMRKWSEWTDEPSWVGRRFETVAPDNIRAAAPVTAADGN